MYQRVESTLQKGLVNPKCHISLIALALWTPIYLGFLSQQLEQMTTAPLCLSLYGVYLEMVAFLLWPAQ